MNRLRRWTLLGLGLVVAGVVASIGVVMPRTIRVVGPDGAPVEAWAAHRYTGHQFSFAHPTEYSRPGAVSRTDAEGNLRLAGTIYWRAPLGYWLQHQIDLLYAPALHAVILQPLAAGPFPRIFARSEDGTLLRLADQARDPEMWKRSLDFFYDFVSYDLRPERGQYHLVPQQTVDGLARQVVKEHRAFTEIHAATPRTMPTVGVDYLQSGPEAERESALAKIRESVAREPLWGPYVERTRGRRIAALERRLAR